MMRFEETFLQGAYIVTLDSIKDERGYFSRSFCKREFEQLGLQCDITQCNISFNNKKGTLRGLHYQASPHEETKIVLCRCGVIYDVIVDIRKDSETYGQWIGIELSAEKHNALYIPKGFAHGFQTLCDAAEVFYLMGEYYHPNAAKGIRWNDPALAVIWPCEVTMISERDKSFPGLLS